jgi:hypothetical protein
VDFQLTHWTSPAIDLQYFLHTSLAEDLQDKHELLVVEYCRYLSQTLSALGYRGLQPSLHHIKQQLQKRGLHAVMTCCTILPVLLVDKNNVPDFAEPMSMQLSKRYKRAMKKFLPVFEEKGWL